MPCYSPLKAQRDSAGVTILPASAVLFNLRVPCGQCVGCRLERSRQWATRIMHEASLHRSNVFVTLTYSNEHVPEDGSLHYDHFQRFMKRLRKRFAPSTVRFYMCGEYGENYSRPHFHACLFNCDFDDKVIWKLSSSGFHIYRSAVLESLWPYGYSSIGDVTFESAAYVARYVMKKITGQAAERHYEVVSRETGEIFSRTPEFNRMSLKPGIGGGWFDKYTSDVFPRDYVVVNKHECRVPRYYDRLFKRKSPEVFSAIKEKRLLDIGDYKDDNTFTRLKVKREVAEAKLSYLKRNL